MDALPGLLVCEAGFVPYDDASLLQNRLVAARQEGQLTHDALILLEHEPVFTLGRRGRRQSLRVDETFLQSRNIRVVSTLRGGDVTFHAPGQLVGYLIMDIAARGIDIRQMVAKVETVLMRAASDYGVQADQDPRGRGVWAGRGKLGSIGFAVSRGISFHGFSINVSNDLSPFEWIDPCGLKGVTMTSLSMECKAAVDMKRLRHQVIAHFSTVFKMKPVRISLNTLNEAAGAMPENSP